MTVWTSPKHIAATVGLAVLALVFAANVDWRSIRDLFRPRLSAEEVRQMEVERQAQREFRLGQAKELMKKLPALRAEQERLEMVSREKERRTTQDSIARFGRAYPLPDFTPEMKQAMRLSREIEEMEKRVDNLIDWPYFERRNLVGVIRMVENDIRTGGGLPSAQTDLPYLKNKLRELDERHGPLPGEVQVKVGLKAP